jgi:hypothetical protein
MKHDTAHEERQNAALRMLAGAVQGVAASHGTHTGDLVGRVNELLGADEAPGTDPDMPSEAALVEAESKTPGDA